LRSGQVDRHNRLVLGRLTAWWLLSWAFAFTLLRRLVDRGRGPEQFRRAYAGDRLLLVSVEERRLLQACSSCIACGRCNRGESDRIAASGGEYSGLMPLVLSSARNTADAQAAARGWRHLSDLLLADKELVCPTHVPLRALKRFVEAKGRELDAVGVAPQGEPQ
jgi:hypothetical protein